MACPGIVADKNKEPGCESSRTKASFKGEFKQNVFMRGVIRTSQGRTIEVDNEKQTYLEVLENGKKMPVDASTFSSPEA